MPLILTLHLLPLFNMNRLKKPLSPSPPIPPLLHLQLKHTCSPNTLCLCSVWLATVCYTVASRSIGVI